jgi:acetylornithine/succinyldiaminopimelate/putrescine aminotransferase
LPRLFADVSSAIGSDVAAIIVEPVQGEGGVIPGTHEFLNGLRSLADANDALLIMDEVQAGLGRCGTLWAHEPSGVKPDIMTLAKPLGGGLPIGATLCTERVASAIKPADHGTTFGGNAAVAAGALEVLRTVSHPAFLKDLQDKGRHLQSILHSWPSSMPSLVKQVRFPTTPGLWAGVELTSPAKPVLAAAADMGVVFITAGPNTIRLSPPLTVTKDEISHAMNVLRQAINSPT